MPTYCYKCERCGLTKEISRPMAQSGSMEFCQCGNELARDIRAEHSSVRGDYAEPIISSAMAFNTQDLAEHRRRFPNIDLQVDGPAHTAYPIFRSLSQKRQYLKARKWQDCRSFV